MTEIPLNARSDEGRKLSLFHVFSETERISAIDSTTEEFMIFCTCTLKRRLYSSNDFGHAIRRFGSKKRCCSLYGPRMYIVRCRCKRASCWIFLFLCNTILLNFFEFEILLIGESTLNLSITTLLYLKGEV